MLDITDIANRTAAYEKAAGDAKCSDINTDRELYYTEKYALAKVIAAEINNEVREELRSIRAVIAENLNEFTWDPCAETATVMAGLFTRYAETCELLV